MHGPSVIGRAASITHPLRFHSRITLSGESCPIPIPPIPIHGVMAKSTAQLVVTAWLSCSRQRWELPLCYCGLKSLSGIRASH